MVYDPTKVPLGMNQSSLQLFRYDTTAGQWTLVPSQVDTSASTLTAYIRHFSVFAPFFVTAGADLSTVQIWPQPCEFGGNGTSPYYSSALNFANLPTAGMGTRVRIFTLTGELVADSGQVAGGVWSWTGANRSGHSAASGTYLVSIEGGGQTKIRRVVIIR
jgi:hypothetical protein